MPVAIFGIGRTEWNAKWHTGFDAAVEATPTANRVAESVTDGGIDAAS